MGETDEYTIDRYKQDLADLVEFERTVRWRKGDVIRRGMAKFGPMNAYRLAAEVLGKSVRWALELAKVAATFEEAGRLPDVDWYLYRLCAGTEDPQGNIARAVEQGMSSKELKAELDTADGENPIPTHVKGQFVMDWSDTEVVLTPAGPLDKIELGDGTAGVPVKATITGVKPKKNAES